MCRSTASSPDYWRSRRYRPGSRRSGLAAKLRSRPCCCWQRSRRSRCGAARGAELVVVLGSINADLVARVEHLPREGETQRASAYAVLPGGKGANQALAACRAGARVALVGAVGRDAMADASLALVRAAGVDTAAVARVDAATGIALIHVDARGANAITIVPGANALVHAAMLPDRDADARTTLVLQLEIPLAEV